MPKIRLTVEYPFVVAVALVLTLGCCRCGGGTQATTGEQRPEPRLPYCRKVGSTVTYCSDDKASVDGATAEPLPANGLR